MKLTVLSLIYALSFLGMSPALADTKLRQAGFWELFESSDGKTCYLKTDNSRFTGDEMIPATISVMVSKAKNNPLQPAEIFVSFSPGANSSNGAQFKSGSLILNLVDYDGRRQNFWGTGANLVQLVGQLKSGSSDFTVSSSGKGRSDRFSTRGFSDVLTDLQNICNQGSPVADVEFFNSFFDSGSVSLNPSTTDSSKAQELRRLYYEAHQSFMRVKTANQELQKILDKYKPYSDELTLNQSRIQKNTTELIPAQEQIIKNAQQEQTRLQLEINRIQTEIQAQNQLIDKAQIAFDQAKAKIAPFEGTFNEISNRLTQANSNLSEAESRLNQIDGNIRVLKSKIQSLETEWQNLNNNLNNKRYQVQLAQDRYQEASRKRAQFDAQREYRDRLNRDFRYLQLQRDLDKNQRDRRFVEIEVRRISHDLNMARLQLDQCLRQPVPPGAPAPTCFNERSQVGILEQSLNNATRDLDRLQSDERRLNQEIYFIESQIRRDVDQIVRRLQDEETQALYDYNRLNRDYQSDLARIDQISRSELPLARNQLDSLNNERPVVVKKISDLKVAVQAISEELRQFKIASDWDNKFSELTRTRDEFRRAKEKSMDLERALLNNQYRLSEAVTIEKSAIKTVRALQDENQRLANRNLELQRILDQLPLERQKFDQSIEEQKRIFIERKDQFRELVK